MVAQSNLLSYLFERPSGRGVRILAGAPVAEVYMRISLFLIAASLAVSPAIADPPDIHVDVPNNAKNM